MSLVSAAALVVSLTSMASAQAAESNRSPVYGPHAHPYGSSLQGWAERFWQRVMDVPLDHNPLADPTGANCAQGQPDSQVWYLSVAFAPTTTAVRSCTVPRHRALVIPMASYLNDYPCPDPSFQPAPGQTLEQFLTAGANQVIDPIDEITLTIDGTPVTGLLNYRSTTHLFTFTGDASLQATDSCITGKRQPGVADGYTVVVKPLTTGVHSIVFTTHNTAGLARSFSYTITVS
jgi:hypothetical protein